MLRTAEFQGYEVAFFRKLMGVDFSATLLLSLWPQIARCDVVHVTAVYSTPTIPALLAARVLSKPVVWSPHGALQRWAESKRVVAKHAWEHACSLLLNPDRSVLHVTSQAEAHESAPRIRTAKAVIIENGVDSPATLPTREWRPQGQLRLLYIGRLDPIKGIDKLLEALANMRDPTVKLRICGTGHPDYVAYLVEMRRQLDLEDTVSLVGVVEGRAKSDEFFRADACVVPSHTENFGMVVAESLAHGTPVIASHGTPWSEIEARGAGLWVSNHPDSLANAISRIRNLGLQKMGQAGRDWMLRSYGWPSIAARMLAVYRGLVRSRTSGQGLS
jgi:glycosyltransferase involved in cell wall biosynthesis